MSALWILRLCLDGELGTLLQCVSPKTNLVRPSPYFMEEQRKRKEVPTLVSLTMNPNQGDQRLVDCPVLFLSLSLSLSSSRGERDVWEKGSRWRP